MKLTLRSARSLSHWAGIAVTVGAVLAASQAAAQRRTVLKDAEARATTTRPDAESEVMPPEGAAAADPYLPYGGVSLRGGDPPAPKTPPAGMQYINWPGFRSERDVGTEVFVQLTGPVTFKATVRGRRVEVVMDKVQSYLKNTLRPMITKHFRGPVEEFAIKPVKGDKMALSIRLKRPAPHQVDIKTIGRYSYLVVSFPPTKKSS